MECVNSPVGVNEANETKVLVRSVCFLGWYSTATSSTAAPKRDGADHSSTGEQGGSGFLISAATRSAKDSEQHCRSVTHNIFPGNSHDNEYWGQKETLWIYSLHSASFQLLALISACLLFFLKYSV